jgi:hypothetical protein
MPEIVRTPLEPLPPGRGRRLEERLALWMPWLYPLLFRMVRRLSPSSRVRQRAIARSVAVGWAAIARHDVAFAMSTCAPDWVLTLDEGVRGLDQSPTYTRDRFEEILEVWEEGFREWERQPRELIDPGGDRFIVAITSRNVGRTSGIETRDDQWITYKIVGGQVHRMRFTTSEADAFAELGLEPAGNR